MSDTRERAIGDAIYAFGLTDGPWDVRLRDAIAAYEKTLWGVSPDAPPSDQRDELIDDLADAMNDRADADVGFHAYAVCVVELLEKRGLIAFPLREHGP